MYYYYGDYNGALPLQVDIYTPKASANVVGTKSNPYRFILDNPPYNQIYLAMNATDYPANGLIIGKVGGGVPSNSDIYFPVASEIPLNFAHSMQSKKIRGKHKFNVSILNTIPKYEEINPALYGTRLITPIASVAVDFTYTTKSGVEYTCKSISIEYDVNGNFVKLTFGRINMSAITFAGRDYLETLVDGFIDFGGAYQQTPYFIYDWIMAGTTETPREINKFDIYLYQNRAEVNRVGKAPDWLDNVGVLHGVLRDECSLTAPTIIFEAQQVPAFNYVHIPIFGRYYFVLGIDSVSKNLWRMRLNCDVLETYKQQIWNLSAVIDRQEKLFNPMLNDIEMPANVNSQILFREFPNEPFNPSGDEILNFVLISVGEGNDFA